MPGFAAARDKHRHVHAPHAARDRGVGIAARHSRCHVVDDVEHAEPPAAGELVVDEIQRTSGRSAAPRPGSGTRVADGEPGRARSLRTSDFLR